MSTARRHAFVLFGAVACAAAGAWADPGTGGVEVIALRHSEAALRATYTRGKRVELPRLVVLDGQGRVVLGETGYRPGAAGRAEEALRRDRALATPITLAAILAETETADGKPLAATDLPPADAYVVDWWAEWCAPCRMLTRDLAAALARWHDRRVVWLQIESDPTKQHPHDAS